MQCFWKLIGCIQCLWHMTAYSLYIRFYKVPQYPGWEAHKNFAVLVMNGLWAFTYGAFLKILLYVGWLFEIYNKNLLDSNFCILFCFLNLDNVFNNVNTLILIRIDTPGLVYIIKFQEGSYQIKVLLSIISRQSSRELYSQQLISALSLESLEGSLSLPENWPD